MYICNASSSIELQSEVSYNQEHWTLEFTCCEMINENFYTQNLIHLQTFLSVKPQKFNPQNLICVQYSKTTLTTAADKFKTCPNHL